jgi:ankyrin repeat protein
MQEHDILGEMPDLPRIDSGPIASVVPQMLIRACESANEEELTPTELLGLACARGDVLSATKLLDEGTNPFATCGWCGHSAVALAVNLHRLAILQVFVSHGIDFSRTVDANGNTALILAAQSGHLSVIDVLTATNCAIDQRNQAGMSALMTACSRGHYAAMDRLLERDASTIAVNKEPTSPCIQSQSSPRLVLPTTDLPLAGTKRRREEPSPDQDDGAVGAVESAVGGARMNSGSQSVWLAGHLQRASDSATNTDAASATTLSTPPTNTRTDEMEEDSNRRGDDTSGWGMSALHFACKKRDLDAMRVLLARGADANERIADGQTLLSYAWSIKGSFVMLRALIMSGNADFAEFDAMQLANASNPFGSAAGHELVMTHDEYEQPMGKAVAQERNGMTAFMVAAYMSSIRFMSHVGSVISREQMLVRNPINGRTALHYAVIGEDGDANAVRHLCDLFRQTAADTAAGEKPEPDLDITPNGLDLADFQGRTPLMLAAQNGERDVLSVLVQAGASLSAIDQDGCTALMFACGHMNSSLSRYLRRTENLRVDHSECEYYRCVNLLCEADPSLVNTKDSHGKTALVYAIDARAEFLVELLLKHSADADMIHPSGKSLLAHSLHEVNNIPIFIKLSLKSAALRAFDADELNSGRLTALMVLIRHRQSWGLDVVDSLIQNGADIHAECTDGETVIGTATTYLRWDYLEKLLSAGCNPNQANKQGVTPLMIACMYQSDPAVKLLLQNGADPSISRPSDGLTPLAFACLPRTDPPPGSRYPYWVPRVSRLLIIRALTEKGADVMIRLPDGQSCADAVCLQGDSGSLECLLSLQVPWSPKHCKPETWNEKMITIFVKHHAVDVLRPERLFANAL